MRNFACLTLVVKKFIEHCDNYNQNFKFLKSINKINKLNKSSATRN